MIESNINRIATKLYRGQEITGDERAALQKYFYSCGSAFHEAGHAVIARTLRLLCGYSTINSEEDSDGHSIIATNLETLRAWQSAGKKCRLSSLQTARVIGLMAGKEAEVRFGYSKEGTDADDLQLIEVTLHDEFFDRIPETLEQYKRKCRNWAQYLVRHHWNSVEKVARSLLTQKTLQPDEIDALIGRPSLKGEIGWDLSVET